MAIRQIKSGKAAGPDKTPAEALKADQLYGSLWNNQLNGIHHSTSTSLTTQKRLTLGQDNSMEASSTLRRSSEDSQYHTEFI
ncbi:unnamed protein product [Schistosoma margrebowiei]|uniref:Uncharacterized protein n=1 Tax=Schistosoma margrebowiei TaxID=48269 RepID=A0A183MUY4_9TREM|nr:unnamed protein product [Schistosoma margrebowiei]